MSGRVALIIALSITALAPVSAHEEYRAEASSRAAAPVAFVGVNVLAMTAARIDPDQTVIVRDGRVVVLGPSRRVRVPRGVTVIDGRGKYLMPGLADMHIHLPPGDHEREMLLKLYIATGITTVLNLNGSPGHLALRGRIAREEIVGPTMYTAGPTVDDSTLTREGGAELAIDAKRAGYDVIKVYNQLSRPGFLGITAAAESVGIPVVGHVVRSMGLEESLAAGQRAVVHAEEYGYTFLLRALTDSEPGERARTAVMVDSAARLTKRANAYVIPTLETFRTIIAESEQIDAMLARDEVAYVPLAIFRRMHWGAAENQYVKRFNQPFALVRLRRHYALQQQLIAALFTAGVPLMTGTDAPVATVVPGFSLAGEIANLVQCGLTPYDALSAATRVPGEFFPSDAPFGRVVRGSRADLLLLDANPLDNVDNVRRRSGVMVRGRWFSARELDAMLSEIRAENARDRAAPAPPNGGS